MTHVELAASLRETARECDAIAAIVEACPPREGWEIVPDPEIATGVDYVRYASFTPHGCWLTIGSNSINEYSNSSDAEFAAEAKAMRAALEDARLKVAAGKEGA
jgi:hypothetical protein